LHYSRNLTNQKSCARAKHKNRSYRNLALQGLSQRARDVDGEVFLNISFFDNKKIEIQLFLLIFLSRCQIKQGFLKLR